MSHVDPNKLEDLFDVVNEKDEVIGVERRKVVHAKGLLHRAIHIWIFNGKGEILIQKRSPWKDTFPNMWTSSVSGHVDSGEMYLKAAIREVKEEVGLKEVPPLKQIGYEPACKETELEFVHLYRCESEGPFTFPKEEVSELRSTAPSVLTTWMEKTPQEFAPPFRHLWNRYKDRL